jgi:hypothetical protein
MEQNKVRAHESFTLRLLRGINYCLNRSTIWDQVMVMSKYIESLNSDGTPWVPDLTSEEMLQLQLDVMNKRPPSVKRPDAKRFYREHIQFRKNLPEGRIIDYPNE